MLIDIGSNIQEILEEVEEKVKIRFYTVNGQKVFPIRSSSAGAATSVICYIVEDVDHHFIRCQPVEFNFWSWQGGKEYIVKKLDSAISQFLQDKLDNNSKLVSKDGGDLGREYDKPLKGAIDEHSKEDKV